MQLKRLPISFAIFWLCYIHLAIIPAALYANPAISPDGNLIAYALPKSSHQAGWEIWKVVKNRPQKVAQPISFSHPIKISENRNAIIALEFSPDGTKLLIIAKDQENNKFTISIIDQKVSLIDTLPVGIPNNSAAISYSWSGDGKYLGIGNGVSFYIYNVSTKLQVKHFGMTKYGTWNDAYGSWVLYQENKAAGYYVWHPTIAEPKLLVALEGVVFPPVWSEQKQVYYQLQTIPLPNQRGELDPPVGSQRYGRTHLIQFALGDPKADSIFSLNQLFGNRMDTKRYWINPANAVLSYVQKQTKAPEIIHHHNWITNRWITQSWIPNGFRLYQLTHNTRHGFSVALLKSENDPLPAVCVLFKHNGMMIHPLIHSYDQWNFVVKTLIDFDRFSQTVTDGKIESHREHIDLNPNTLFPIPASVSVSRFTNEYNQLKFDLPAERIQNAFKRWIRPLVKSYSSLSKDQPEPSLKVAGLFLYLSAVLQDEKKCHYWLAEIESQQLNITNLRDLRIAELELRLKLEEIAQAKVAREQLTYFIDQNLDKFTEPEKKQLLARYQRLIERLSRRLETP